MPAQGRLSARSPISVRCDVETARFVEPMQCLPVAKLPEGSNWEYEVKFDGYRALGIKRGGRVRLMSRNENDLADQFPILAQALAELPDETSIEGELVALDETGRPSPSGATLLARWVSRRLSIVFGSPIAYTPWTMKAR